MLKKLCSALLALSMLIGVFTSLNVMAYDDLSTSSQNTAASLVTALGIMEADSSADFGSKTIVTRGQFALYVTRLLKYSVSKASAGAKGSFDDVDISTEQGAAVQLLADMGAVSKGAREFNPNVGINYNEAVRMLLSALGYDIMAQNNGGYPSGYTRVASDNKLNDGLGGISTTALTKPEVAVILYNALFVYPMEDVNREYKQAKKTILEKIYNVTELTGIVTGYEKTSITGEQFGDNVICIGDETYDCTADDAQDYVGCHVKAYYAETNTGGTVIVALTETQNKNTITKLDTDDVDSVNGTRVEYYPDGGRSKKTLKITSNPAVIYNGRYTSDSLADVIDSVVDGDVKFIANDGTSAASVVVVNSYKHLLVERVDTRNYRLYLRNSSGSSKDKNDPTYLPDSVTTDPDDIDLEVYIGDEKVDFDKIEAGDAVTMKESADGDDVVLQISRNVVSGKITSVSDDKMSIDSKSYDVSPFVDKAYTIGTSGTFAITTDGKILGLVEVTDKANNYAYVLKSYAESGPNKAWIKIFTSKGEVIEDKCVKNVLINGAKRSYNEVEDIVKEGDLITYTRNSNGEFTKLDRPYDASSRYVSVDKEGNLSLYVNDTDFVKDWNKSSVRYVDGIMGMTFITEDTTIFSMPRFDEGDESEYKILKASDLENRTYSDVTAFDIDRQGRAGAILIVEDVSDSVSMSAPLFFISKAVRAVNDDGEDIVRIKGFEKGEEITLDFDDGSKSVTYEDGWMNYSGNEDFDTGYENLRVGDAIQYTLGSDGVVSAYRLVYNNEKTAYDKKGRFIENNSANYYEDWSGTGAVTKGDFSDNLYIAYGDVQMRYMDYMVILGLNQADRLKYASSLSPVSIMDYYRPMNLLKNAYVYVYNVNTSKDSQRLEIGDMSDIERGDVCFVRSKKMGELNE
ncbi:MAG: hypothetical protein IJP94_07890, partial [Clostridia bacterium]|nr:hypothetical protein [Clostridia bacterium]